LVFSGKITKDGYKFRNPKGGGERTNNTSLRSYYKKVRFVRKGSIENRKDA